MSRMWIGLVVAWAMAVSGLAAEPVGPGLQAVSVNICCPSSYGGAVEAEGSGTLVVGKVGDKPAVWVLTAHHVVKDLRSEKEVVSPGGEKKTHVSYRDAQIIQERVVDGRAVGETKVDAKVVSVDERRDIALLRIRDGEFKQKGVTFYAGKDIPQPGTALYHCGAPGGKEIGGTCSLTAGIVSRLGVRIPEFGGSEHGVFDQVDCPALGGSSGGLVALRDSGQWVGMITLGLGGGDSFHWIVPVRSVREWATEIKAEWLLDPGKPQPKEEDVAKIPLENQPVGFANAKPQEAPKEGPAVARPDVHRDALPPEFLRTRQIFRNE